MSRPGDARAITVWCTRDHEWATARWLNGVWSCTRCTADDHEVDPDDARRASILAANWYSR